MSTSSAASVPRSMAASAASSNAATLLSAHGTPWPPSLAAVQAAYQAAARKCAEADWLSPHAVTVHGAALAALAHHPGVAALAAVNAPAPLWDEWAQVWSNQSQEGSGSHKDELQLLGLTEDQVTAWAGDCGSTEDEKEEAGRGPSRGARLVLDALETHLVGALLPSIHEANSARRANLLVTLCASASGLKAACDAVPKDLKPFESEQHPDRDGASSTSTAAPHKGLQRVQQGDWSSTMYRPQLGPTLAHVYAHPAVVAAMRALKWHCRDAGRLSAMMVRGCCCLQLFMLLLCVTVYAQRPLCTLFGARQLPCPSSGWYVDDGALGLGRWLPACVQEPLGVRMPMFVL